MHCSTAENSWMRVNIYIHACFLCTAVDILSKTKVFLFSLFCARNKKYGISSVKRNPCLWCSVVCQPMWHQKIKVKGAKFIKVLCILFTVVLGLFFQNWRRATTTKGAANWISMRKSFVNEYLPCVFGCAYITLYTRMHIYFGLFLNNEHTKVFWLKMIIFGVVQ